MSYQQYPPPDPQRSSRPQYLPPEYGRAVSDDTSISTALEPGETVQARLVFDVPEGAEATHIELHDSIFSDGTTVTLES